MRALKPILLAFALAACATPSATMPVDANTTAALNAANRAFSAAYLAGEAETIIAAYTPTAVIHTPEGGVYSTPASIRALWAPLRAGSLAHSLDATYRQTLSPGVVLELGRWHIASRVGGEERHTNGCYTLVWRQSAAGWRMEYDAWTPSRDPAPECLPH